MVTFTVTTLGEERFIRAFNRITDEVRDFSGAFEEIWTDFLDMEQKTFASEGPGWVPLSARYAKWKALHYPGKPLMRLTDRLYESLVNGTEDTVKIIQPTFARFGTNVPYAHRHQMGGGGLPARKVVNLTEEDKKRWAKIIQRFAMQRMGARAQSEGIRMTNEFRSIVA